MPKKRKSRGGAKPVDLEALWRSDLSAFAEHLGVALPPWLSGSIRTVEGQQWRDALDFKNPGQVKFDEDTRWQLAEEMLWWAASGEAFDRRAAAVAKGRKLDSLRASPAALAKHLGLKLTKPQQRWLKEAKDYQKKRKELRVDQLHAFVQRHGREVTAQEKETLGYSAKEFRKEHQVVLEAKTRVADSLTAKAKKLERQQLSGTLREVQAAVGVAWGKPSPGAPPTPPTRNEQISNQNSRNRDKGKKYTPAEKEAKMRELRRTLGEQQRAKAVKAFMTWSGCSRSTAYSYAEKIGWKRS